MRAPRSQRLECPVLHGTHRPQAGMPANTTWSPGDNQLTPEQKDLVKKETGKEADAVELTANELEDRIAPLKVL